MTSGIKREIEEVDEIKLKILDHLSGGYGRTFMGACQVAGVSPAEAYLWRKDDQPFADAVRDARYIGGENAKDVAERNVMTLLTNGDPKTTRWFLETKGKDRGYVKRSELTGKDGPLFREDPAGPVVRGTEEEAAAAFNETLRRERGED